MESNITNGSEVVLAEFIACTTKSNENLCLVPPGAIPPKVHTLVNELVTCIVIIIVLSTIILLKLLQNKILNLINKQRARTHVMPKTKTQTKSDKNTEALMSSLEIELQKLGSSHTNDEKNVYNMA